MSKQTNQNAEGTVTDYGETVVQLTKRADGTWEATQAGLPVVGTGESAARATEDMAAKVAASTEDGTE
ncbi:hypothetical protein [Halorussus sp. AFM4]|uniref:hypothetical protein n=1 Tax=Halorussus sp. AFM4 TaxID=3421651 RepID=UPI003EBBE336